MKAFLSGYDYYERLLKQGDGVRDSDNLPYGRFPGGFRSEQRGWPDCVNVYDGATYYRERFPCDERQTVRTIRERENTRTEVYPQYYRDFSTPYLAARDDPDVVSIGPDCETIEGVC